MKNNKTNNTGAEPLSIKVSAGFAANNLGNIMNATFLSFLTFFATDSLYLSAASVGMVLLLSKFLDGITDVLAGILIDKTRTRFGKARPFALFGVFAWISLVFLFMVPDVSPLGKAIYIFVFYNLNNSVFFTLVNVARTVHLKRCLHEEANRIKVLTISGLVYALGNVAFNVVFPIIVDKISGHQGRWVGVAAGLAAFGIVGSLMSFFFCKEYPDENEGEEVVAVVKEKIPFKEYIGTLLKNRYILLFGLMQFTVALVAYLSTGSGTYYFTYIVGNLAMLAIVSAASIVSFPVIPFVPKLVAKLGKKGFLLMGFSLGAIGALIRLIGYDNVAVIAVGNALTNFGIMPGAFIGPEIVIGCMEYSERKSGVKAQAIFSSVDNFANKLGAGIGNGALGMILAFVGYNGALEVQSVRALSGINFIYNWVPIICYTIMIVVTFIWFDLDKQLKILRQADAEK